MRSSISSILAGSKRSFPSTVIPPSLRAGNAVISNEEPTMPISNHKLANSPSRTFDPGHKLPLFMATKVANLTHHQYSLLAASSFSKINIMIVKLSIDDPP